VPLHPSLPRQPRAHLLQVPDSVAHRGSGHTLSSRMQCKGAATAHRWSRQASNRGCARAQVSPGGAPERAVGDDGGGWHPCGGPSGPPGRGRAGGADALVRLPILALPRLWEAAPSGAAVEVHRYVFFFSDLPCVSRCVRQALSLRDGPCAALLVSELHDLCAVWQ